MRHVESGATAAAGNGGRLVLRHFPLLPWIGGVIVAFAFCAGYGLMGACRQAWQSHYPDLAQEWANNGRFAVIGWFGTELSHEELGYAARTQNASRHFPAYDPYIRESHSRRQMVNDALTYALLGAMKNVLGDINRTWIFARFICCVFWFVLIYHLTLRICGAPPLAVFSATFVCCFSYLLTFLFLANLQWGGPHLSIWAHNAWTAVSYGRTESLLRLPRPGLTYAFLFLATLWVVKAVESRGWKWALLSGVLGGALAYIRLDVWSAHLLATYIMAAVYSVKDRRVCWRLAASAAIATLLSLPFLYYNYPPDPELLLRNGMGFQRHFDLHSIPYALAFWAGLRYKHKPVELFLACMAASTFVMVNIELVTGYNMQADHWKYFGNIYMFLLALAFLAERLRARRPAWLGGAVLLAVAAFLQGTSYAAIHFPFQGLPKDYDQALYWLDHNTPGDSVVFTLNPEVDTLIPAYTHDKVLLSYVSSSASDYPLLSNCRRLLGGLRLLGAAPERFLADCVFRQKLYDRRSIVATGLRRGEIEKDEFYTVLFYSTPMAAARQIMARALARPDDVAPDYVWFGLMEKEYADKRFPDQGQWEEVFRNAAVTLYRRKAAFP